MSAEPRWQGSGLQHYITGTCSTTLSVKVTAWRLVTGSWTHDRHAAVYAVFYLEGGVPCDFNHPPHPKCLVNTCSLPNNTNTNTVDSPD